MMEERTIELTVISATDLKRVVKFGKQTCYAVAYIYPKQPKKTKKDSDRGTDPTWNEKLKLTCDEQELLSSDLFMTVELYSDGTFSDKLIGTVTIPVSEIARDTVSKGGEEKEDKVKEKEHEAQYLAFEVRRPSGKAKGVLNAAIKFGEKRTIHVHRSQPPPEAYAYGQSSADPEGGQYLATGYPPAPYPTEYPPEAYGASPAAYPNQYPPQQVPYYPQQPAPYYPQAPPQYYQQQPARGGGGSMGLGLGAGLLGGAVGGLLVADAIDDIGDDGGDCDF